MHCEIVRNSRESGREGAWLGVGGVKKTARKWRVPRSSSVLAVARRKGADDFNRSFNRISIQRVNGFLSVVGIRVRVNLGGGDGGMTEQGLHGSEVRFL